MRSGFLLVFLVCVAIALVQSETSVEVDENGDEYEVKRFNVQGRQLNGGRSQCVVSRRKRASAGAAPESSEKTKNENSNSAIQPSALTLTLTAGDDEVQDADDADEDDFDKPVSQQDAELHSAVTSPDGIVVVETDTPPKVNPQTHAVFELLPVGPTYGAADDNGHNDNYDDDYEDDYDDDDHLHYEEEISPVSTTAIWSTGVDDDDFYDDLNPIKDDTAETGQKKKPLKPNNSGSKQKKKPGKAQPGKAKPGKAKPGKAKPGKAQPGKAQPAKKLPNKNRPNKNRPNKNRPNKKRPNKNRPARKGQRPGLQNKLRAPVNKKQQQDLAQRKQNNQKAKKQNMKVNRLDKNSNRRLNSNLGNRNTKRKKLNNSENVNQGTNSFTKTVTMTQTGGSNDRDVNCIIINKSPPPVPTTARPFWNILGRDAGGVPDQGFGRRKRVNMRFSA